MAADEIPTAVRDRDPESRAELSGAGKETRRVRRPFRGAQKDGLRPTRAGGDDVRAGMHSVDEVDVQVPALRVHRFDARGTPPAEGMGRRIPGAQIRLGLDDARGVPASAPAPREIRPDEIPRHRGGRAPIKRPFRLGEAESRRIEDEPRIRCPLRYHAASL